MADPVVFKIKQGDRRPYLEVQLVRLDESGEVEGPQDLTGATDIVFTMRNKSTGITKIDRGTDVTTLDAVEGQVRYEWQDGDTDTIGNFLGEFEVSYSGEAETFPNGKLGFDIKVTEQLG